MSMKGLHINKKKLLTGVAVFAGLCLLVLTALYVERDKILRYYAGKRVAAMEEKYGLAVTYDSLYMNGVDEVRLRGLAVVPQQRDTLLTLHSMDLQFSLWKLLFHDLDVRNVRVDGLDARLIKRDTISNYDFLFKKRREDAETQKPRSFSSRVNDLLDLTFGILPRNGEFTRMRILQQKDKHFVTLNLPSLSVVDNNFCTPLDVREDNFLQHWMMRGELNHAAHTVRSEIYAADGRPLSMPYVTRRFGARVNFNLLSFSLTRHKDFGGDVSLKGEATVSGLSVFHPALSPEAVDLSTGRFSYFIYIGTNSIELDPASTVTFNRLTFHPSIRAEKKKDKWHIIASVDKSWFPADELFSSLPRGLFANLQGIRTSGNLAYHFLLDIDFANLNALKFESSLEQQGFHILSYGAGNLDKMSGEFMYTAYENGRPVRTFPVGPSWEHYTPLDSISPLLQNAVMQSEDGAFFRHRGFLPDAMRAALIHDLKVKRFARGGSTITMQLVKNVFLTRNKNIARKLEEALIVWLIENQQLTSKQRMLEVYLNIAEWGPLIYGIGEASDFYFKKKPSQLSLEECIFLASIIPKPKHFLSCFDSKGELKGNLAGYYRLIARQLVRKGLIDAAEADSIHPHIVVSGAAQEVVRRKAGLQELPEEITEPINGEEEQLEEPDEEK